MTALEGEGEITGKYQPVVVLDYQDLAQETFAILSQSALVVGNLESVLSPAIRIVVTMLWSTEQSNISERTSGD